jgi:hypothetical protein
MFVPPAGAAFTVKLPSNSHNSQRWALVHLFYLGANPVFDLLGGHPALFILSPQADGERASSGRIQRIKERSTTPLDAHNPGIRTKKLGR